MIVIKPQLHGTAHQTVQGKIMAKVARGDSDDSVDCNHPCLGTTTTDGMSSNVFVNGTGVHRQDDASVTHLSGADSPICAATHTPTIAVGSTTVFANNKGVARKDEAYNASDTVASGSDTVFAGP